MHCAIANVFVSSKFPSPNKWLNALNESNALNTHIVLQFPIFVFNSWEQVDFGCRGDQQMEAILKDLLSKDFL
jgi:hypothetical protein